MRQFFLYNTASRSKEPFEPLNDPVAMYCCGPTVYNFAHIGNLRTYIFEDVLKRTLLALGYRVRHVVNITDVGHLTSDADSGEDKMEKGAQREGKSVWDIADFFTGKFKENIKELNILDPDIWPKATEHIPQMIELIKLLESKAFTYKTSDGIYFDTTKFPSYCDFARLDPSSLRAGERVDMGEKRAVTDFALWKFSPTDVKRQMEWDSPWGIGFPGWHIECSAMSLAYLPQPLDIHCGGADHVRVHHTNEIAQTEAATGKKFAKYWAHGEFLVVDKGKMAKSGENFVTLDSFKPKQIESLAYRMFCFTAHYSNPLTFSWDGVEAAANSLINLRQLVASLADSAGENTVSGEQVEHALSSFYDAVCDDLNMPRAVAALWDLLKDESLSKSVRYECVKNADKILALDLLKAKGHTQTVTISDEGQNSAPLTIKFKSETQLPDDFKEDLIKKIRSRRDARAKKDFKTADQIRNELTMLGITVKDLPDGTCECIVASNK
ncbi:MAG: cysteine--tRNA ligase [Fibrobacter sp.]|nr:cysteine--tRNA ligase [Fibrobacter sp.]